MWVNLADLTGARVTEFPVEAIPAVLSINEDEEASAVFRKAVVPEGSDFVSWFAQRAERSRLALMQRHSKELAVIFAANAGIGVEEWERNTSVTEYYTDLNAMFLDPGMRSFFTSAQTATATFS